MSEPTERSPTHDPQVHRFTIGKAGWGARLPRRGLLLAALAALIVAIGVLLALL